MSRKILIEKKRILINQYFNDCQTIREKYKKWRRNNPHVLDGPEIGEEKKLAEIFYYELRKINAELEKLNN